MGRINVVKNILLSLNLLSDLDESDANSVINKISGGTGVGISMAPVVYNGKVIIGITGVGYGLHVGEEEGATYTIRCGGWCIREIRSVRLFSCIRYTFWSANMAI